MKRNNIFIAVIGIVFFGVSAAFAEAEVIDLSENQAATPMPMMAEAPTSAISDTRHLSTQQRLDRLEQQFNNLIQMNLSSRLDALQQETQKLNGQSEQQAHDVKAIKNQLRDFYKDLAGRINQAKAISGDGFTEKDVNGSSLDSASTNLPSATSAIAEVDHHALVPKEQKAYEDAFNLLQQEKYSSAAQKLRAYLKIYPNGTYIINAHYWLAECNYLLGKFPEAEREFKIIVSQHANSSRTPDALLKLGIIHDNMGKHKEARKEFIEVQKRFPKSSAAELATQHLSTMLED